MPPKDAMDSKDKVIFLGDAINTATRPVHTKLNKLILLRLPLAIPPRARDSSSYVSGILHIAPLYICFESLWHAALHASSPSSPDPTPSDQELEECTFLLPPSKNLPRPSPRIHQILSKLFMPGLLRSTRLRADLRTLSNQSDEEIQSRIEDAASTGRLGEMISHIRRSVERHPHVLLSYAWVLYMALFSGGRFIRATLENAGRANPDFWGHHDDNKPLQFFRFGTPADGEDLKVEFKARMAEMDGLLTEEEREVVVREATCIFENLILVIAQLDDVCHTRVDDMRSPLEELSNPFGRSGRSGFRIRDSVLVAKERASKRRGGSVEGMGAVGESAEGSGETEEEGSVDEGEEEDDDEKGEKKQVEKEELASSSSSSDDSSSEPDSPTFDVDPDLAARLAKTVVHFDAKLPVPLRTENGVNGRQGSQNDGASDIKVEMPKRFAVGVNVAVCLGSVAFALLVMYFRQ